MKIKVREIHGAYIGRHCEVVGPLGQRVYPPLSGRTFRNPASGLDVPLGTNRDACLGFLAGYAYALEQGGKS